MVPVDTAGRVIARNGAGRVEGWSAESSAELRRWILAYDAGGGYSAQVDARLGAAQQGEDAVERREAST